MEPRDTLTIAAVQFEMAEDDKDANLATMFRFIDRAADAGADIVAFQEIATTGYNYLFEMDRAKLLATAECTRTGPTATRIHAKSKERGIVVLYGILEKDPADGDRMYNTYVVCTPDALNHFQHRKVHAFENSEILPGDRLDVFELFGWTMGCLICYDNNLVENPRVLCLKGADIVFAPHQTGGFDIASRGMGRIPLDLWRNRGKNPAAIRQEIDGPKGYQWIRKWLPARAYDNNLFYVFANGVGIDGPEVRVGCSMIVDPEGIVLEETRALGDDMIVATIDKAMRVRTCAGGHIKARRPGLYDKIVEPIREIDTRLARNELSGHKIK